MINIVWELRLQAWLNRQINVLFPNAPLPKGNNKKVTLNIHQDGEVR